MPARTPTPPRLPKSLPETVHDDLTGDDEWNDERVVGVDLAGADAEHVRIGGCELRDVAFTGAHLHRCALTDVRLVGCDLSGAFVGESQWLRVELRNCRMAGFVVSQSRLRHVRFTEAKIDGGDFRLVSAENLAFVDCALADADFYEANLTRVSFEQCDLRRAHFAGVTAHELRLHGSDVEGVRGAASLKGTSITAAQVHPLALSLFAELGISIDLDPRNHE